MTFTAQLKVTHILSPLNMLNTMYYIQMLVISTKPANELTLHNVIT